MYFESPGDLGGIFILWVQNSPNLKIVVWSDSNVLYFFKYDSARVFVGQYLAAKSNQKLVASTGVTPPHWPILNIFCGS